MALRLAASSLVAGARRGLGTKLLLLPLPQPARPSTRAAPLVGVRQPQLLASPASPPGISLVSLASAFHASAREGRPAVAPRAATASAPCTTSPGPPYRPPSASYPPSPSSPPSAPTPRIVGYHSLLLALLVYTIILVGGLTRLTESGLSITEWNPGLKGMWLPSSDEDWEGEWAKYRQTPEFVVLNARMSLDDFKAIYLWEWSHRVLGRVIGVAYLLPALYFLARGYVQPPFRSKLLLIGLGIGAQGAMGWYMVKSGLAAPAGSVQLAHAPHSPAPGGPTPPAPGGPTPPAPGGPTSPATPAAAATPPAAPASWTPRVSHFRLAAHLGLAFLVYAGMLRTGLSILREYNLATHLGTASGLSTGPGLRQHLVSVLSRPEVTRYKRFAAAVTALVFVTAMSGALVAGLDAGLVYNEFPTMGDGRIAPPLDEMFDERYGRRAQPQGVAADTPGSSAFIIGNLTQNPVTVQFIHRCLAITTFAHVVALSWKTRSLSQALAKSAILLPPAIPRLATACLAMATIQASLGISTLIYLVPIPLASAHQAGSVALLSVMLMLWGALRVPSSRGAVGKIKQAYSVAQAPRRSPAVVVAVKGFTTLARCTREASVASRRAPERADGPPTRPFSTTTTMRRTLSSLPDKVRIRTGPVGRLAKVLPPRESSDVTTRVGSSYGGNHSLEWVEAPHNIFIITKTDDDKTQEAMKRIIDHVATTYPEMNIVLEEGNSHVLTTSPWSDKLSLVTPADSTLLARKVDIVITLGGDGTILHASSLFDHSPVPPVLSFSMGTLGFLLPWHIDHFKSALRDLIESKVTLLLRMRLRQTIHQADGESVRDVGEIHLMNEVALHRGREPHMTTIDAFVDGRHLTQAISDGLIIASPTGSTAYSLSAGGPIVHPSVQSLLLTPICPRSLSFRPVLLPSDSTIQLKIASHSRSSAELTIDGREIQTLTPGQYLQISMSPFPIPCVNRASSSDGPHRYSATQEEGEQMREPRLIEGDQAIGANPDRGEDDWVKDINTLLRFNASFAGRGLLGSAEEGEQGGDAKKR